MRQEGIQRKLLEWTAESGLDQETEIAELVACVISETRSIKRDWIHVW